MDFRAKYVPKSRKKVNYKIVVPFVILVMIGGILVYTTLMPKYKEPETAFTICNTTISETQAIITKKIDEANKENKEATIGYQDVGMFGQTLGIYKEPYNRTVRDAFSSKTVFLKNICTEEERAYLMGAELDAKIPVEGLTPGFYEIRVLDGLTKARLVSNEVREDAFSTISIDGYRKNIKLISNKDLFNSKEHPFSMDENYSFLVVDSVESNDQDYDIVLDPSGMIKEFNGNISKGIINGDFVEADAMYDIADGVKKQLEARGLKVKLTRTKDEVINYHGKNNRIQNAYDANAKYFVSFTMVHSLQPLDYGSTAIYSNYVTNRFATIMMKNLTETSPLRASRYVSGQNMDGVIKTSFKDEYDMNAILRETGGIFTGAGSKGEFAKENSFATNSKTGMQALVLELGYTSDPQDIKTIREDKDKIIEATTKGILAEVGIKE